MRDWVELGLKQGALKAVVCTSSLDLGVDFLPVERVLQIGSPKGVARLMQRAGRSGHAPGRTSRVTLVPTHSLEVIEAAAAQVAVAERRIEARSAPQRPLDVLVQHLVSMALGGGFRPEELFVEVRQAWSYRQLDVDQWQWALAFVRHGGHSLTAYPDYQRVEPDESGLWKVPSKRVALRHRMSIGTIVSDASLTVKFWARGGTGRSLGSVEEGFIARLRPGDNFLFAGRLLELVRVENMTVYVNRASGRKAAVPRWNGGRMPLSSELADAVVEQLGAAARGRFDSQEMRLVQPLLQVQMNWSALPSETTLLAEVLKSREGWHLFLYPFAGRHVHLGLASLLAWRMGQRQPLTFSIAVNDYGLELLSATEVDWLQGLTPALFDTGNLLHDVLASLNAGELARRRFREIARIAGLVFSGYPGAQKSARQLQASSGLRRVPPVRPGQPAADPGRGRSAAPGAGCGAAGTDPDAPAAASAGRASGQTHHPAGLSADGRAFSRKPDFGKAGRPHPTYGRRAGQGRRSRWLSARTERRHRRRKGNRPETQTPRAQGRHTETAKMTTVGPNLFGLAQPLAE